jgi:transposase
MARRKPTRSPKQTHRRSYTDCGPLPVSRQELTKGIQLDADVEIERQKRMEELKASLLKAIAEGRGADAVDQVVVSILELERENERLAWRVLRANRYRFGRRTEKLSPDELQQLNKSLGGENTDSQAPTEPPVPTPAEPEQDDDPASDNHEHTEPETTETDPKDKKKRRRVHSMRIGPEVERRKTVIHIPDDERFCALCGREKNVYGYVVHQCIRYVPAKIIVEEEHREKAGCVACRKEVSVAPRSSIPAIERKVDASLLASLVTKKCVLGLPLDRQRRELARLGLDVPAKTMQSYWAYVIDLVEPVATATQSLAFGQAIVGVDDSPLRTLDPGATNGIFRGHLWCFVGTDRVVGSPPIVAYGYTDSWEATEIADWFSAIDGFIQCDGYAGYSAEVEDEEGTLRVPVPDDRRLGCGMHIRSKFHAALLSNDSRAGIVLKYFADIYRIEADCKKRGLDAAARGEERRRRSLPILDQMKAWIDELHPKLLPKSPLRIATTYAIGQWDYFRRCFLDGQFEIDNGRVERRIRLFAIARRGFLFTGSVRGGERLAAAFTLVDNCLTLGIDPHAYLVDIINKLERGWPLRDLSALIPQNWARQQADQHGAK